MIAAGIDSCLLLSSAVLGIGLRLIPLLVDFEASLIAEALLLLVLLSILIHLRNIQELRLLSHEMVISLSQGGIQAGRDVYCISL